MSYFILGVPWQWVAICLVFVLLLGAYSFVERLIRARRLRAEERRREA